MTKVTQLLGLSIAAGLALLLAGCLDKPVQEAKVEVSGDTVTFPAYTILEGELEAPAQGPYTKFAGEYPPHWPSTWQLDARFYTPGGVIPETVRSLEGQQAATFEFDGAFQGTADELEMWGKDQAKAQGLELEVAQLSTTFNAIERRRLGIPEDAWDKQGFAGEVILTYGPRYGGYTHYSLSLVQRMETAKASVDSANAVSGVKPEGASVPAPVDVQTK
jgi:hypothetical protein